ncbi:LysR substrate-binding domain-containing protein [Albimonas pacifica]|uniref:Transcriptional regulator, LysR family n=1 Tax=Albimonas pacifica TaxID=1114924 RepID=A0A1I3CJI2_9RHOB|nr:LysR substrate-binding domain-containing protein [Albimonas pacifica]SFH74493.1 transcriptional regulator, LysR family [Albimonas pacifica]
MDRLQSLRIFAAVAEAGGFAAGARAVGLSAPSATRGVNELEAQLGARLFTRTTRRVRLTDVGRAYLAEVQEVLARLQAADEAAAGAGGSPAGRVRLTCPQEFGRIHVAALLTEFLDLHPRVTVEALMVDRVVNLVEEGVDVAIRIGPLPASDLAAVRVGAVRRVVCGAPAYFARHGTPQAPRDLPGHRIVATHAGGGGPVWRFGPGEREAVRCAAGLTVTSVAASIEIARSGWGLCRALSYQVDDDVEAGRLVCVLEDHAPEPLPVHVVHVEGRRTAPKIRAFVDFAARRLRRIPQLAGA